MRKLATAAILLIVFIGTAFANGGSYAQNTPQSLSANSVTLTPGSLKVNIVRIAKKFGWQRVVWKPSNDYKWVGTTQVYGNSAQVIFRKILADYPLQAQFYLGNHILVIVPRTL